MEFKITVSKRIAQTTSTESLICGNDGDTLTVTFDDEWTNISAKTARLVWIKGGEYTYIDVPFTVIQAKMLFVGFFAGDSTENTLKTSTPAQIPCISSILDVPAEAFTPDVYRNILDIIANKVDKVTGKGLSTNDYTDSAKSFLEETVPEQIDRIDAKITEVEGNVYSNFKNKVDKENGKGLSANDFTTELKDKLDGVEEGANKTAVDAELSATSENPVQNKAVKAALANKAGAEQLEKVINACCDVKTVPGGNYNLMKVSEVSFSSRQCRRHCFLYCCKLCYWLDTCYLWQILCVQH